MENCYNSAGVLIDEDGNFDKNILHDLNLSDDNSCRVAAVSIIGVQSTGKSTLLNKCFSTGFQEMDYTQGMSRTTKGIWIAKGNYPDTSHKILVIDTEGTDGYERGREGDDSFERKTTLFALAMSNTVIFNMKCDSVNLRQGASQPLMETVFQVMVRKFSTPRQINLLFVLRDKNMCSLDGMRQQLIRRLHEIWDGMTWPRDRMNVALEGYFKIEVVTMSNYRHEREQFDTEVVSLRNRIFGLVEDCELGTASGFIALAEKNWNDIEEDKIINLCLNKIAVAEVFCVGLVDEKIEKFRNDERWLQIQGNVKSGRLLKGFGNSVCSVIDTYISEYDEETLYLDEITTKKYRQRLTEHLLKDVENTYLCLVERMRNATSESFLEKIMEMMKVDGKLEDIRREKFITQFMGLLEDAQIRQAPWDRTSEQSEILRSELASYEEGAHYIFTKLKKLKKMKTVIWTSAAGVGLGTISLAAIMSIDILGATVFLPGIGTFGATAIIAAIQTGAGTFLPSASIVGFITALCDYRKKEKELKEACERDPVKKAIMIRYNWESYATSSEHLE